MKITMLVSVLAFSSLLLTTGCQTRFPQEPEPPSVKTTETVFDFDGIPARKYYVGGGNVIRFIATENGMLFLADDTEKRLMESISLQAGEQYETRYDSQAPNRTIKLYFVPETKR